jgi:hypothetical protein
MSYPRLFRLFINGQPVRDYPQRAAANGAAIIARAQGHAAHVVPIGY